MLCLLISNGWRGAARKGGKENWLVYLLWWRKRNTSSWLTFYKFNKLIEFITFNKMSDMRKKLDKVKLTDFRHDGKSKRCLYTKCKCQGKVTTGLFCSVKIPYRMTSWWFQNKLSCAKSAKYSIREIWVMWTSKHLNNITSFSFHCSGIIVTQGTFGHFLSNLGRKTIVYNRYFSIF